MLEVINLLQTTYLDPGTVSVRVAFVLRSTEVIPAFSDLFPPPNAQPPVMTVANQARFPILSISVLPFLCPFHFIYLSIYLFIYIFLSLFTYK